jgi:hypothetical protein
MSRAVGAVVLGVVWLVTLPLQAALGAWAWLRHRVFDGDVSRHG